MERNKKYLLFIVIFFLTGLITNYFLDKRYEKLMSKNTKQTVAIYKSFTVVRNTGPISYFYFRTTNKEKILLEELGKYDFLKKGDTVLIKYSLEDPDIAEVINFCYMKKHKGKDYCNCLDE